MATKPTSKTTPTPGAEKQTRNRRSPEQRAQADLDKAQKGVDRANAHLERAQAELHAAEAEQKRAQRFYDYAILNPDLPDDMKPSEDIAENVPAGEDPHDTPVAQGDYDYEPSREEAPVLQPA